MNKLIIAISIFLLANQLNIIAQELNFNSRAKRMIELFEAMHPNPYERNENTSSEITTLFINELDPDGKILIQADVDSILKYKKDLFSDIENNTNGYILNAIRTYNRAIMRIDTVLDEIAKNKVNFNVTDTIYFESIEEPTFYSANEKDFKRRMTKGIKYRCFERLYYSADYDKLSENEFLDSALEISAKVIERLKRENKEYKINWEERIIALLLNSMAMRYDPHSNYFTSEQNRQFNDMLSSQVESFGFNLSEDQAGNIILVDIITGGPAWQSSIISENDVLISLKIGQEEYFASDYYAYEISEKLSQSEEKIINLSLKKQNGQLKNIDLIKQKTNSIENRVKGYLLELNSEKVGYIALPSFYIDMTNQFEPGAANEMTKEILKLENDSIKGLIIDLRNNGGGSMLEASDLAGIFVDEGPLYIMKIRNQKPQVIKDLSSGVLFNKPVVVLINEASASASELFSNIVKDYNLGVIVGQKSYGKGTVQIMMPLNSGYSNNSEIEEFAKITEGCFYRLNNTSHHTVGVIPDILLPETPILGKYSGKGEQFQYKPDAITKKVKYSPLKKKDIEKLKDLSAKRINQSSVFKQYQKYTGIINSRYFSSSKLCLNFKDYKAYKQNEKAIIDSLDKIFNEATSPISCRNYSSDDNLLETDEQAKKVNQEVLKDIEKDIFIKESFFILMDYLNLN